MAFCHLQGNPVYFFNVEHRQDVRRCVFFRGCAPHSSRRPTMYSITHGNHVIVAVDNRQILAKRVAPVQPSSDTDNISARIAFERPTLVGTDSGVWYHTWKPCPLSRKPTNNGRTSCPRTSHQCRVPTISLRDMRSHLTSKSETDENAQKPAMLCRYRLSIQYSTSTVHYNRPPTL